MSRVYVPLPDPVSVRDWVVVRPGVYSRKSPDSPYLSDVLVIHVYRALNGRLNCIWSFIQDQEDEQHPSFTRLDCQERRVMFADDWNYIGEFTEQ